MTDTLRWGILSTANIGLRAIVPALQAARNCRVVAIASREVGRAREAAQRAGIPRAYGDYADLLTDPEVDAVYVPLPNHLHVEWTLRAIEVGKHVLCEKPMALTAAGVDAIAQAAEARGVVVMEALMYRFHPQTERIMDIVRSGTLGPLQLVAASFTYNVPDPNDIRLKYAVGGGVLQDVGSYCVSVARLVFEAEPVEVQGSQRVGPDSEVDEVFAGLLRFPGGLLASFGCALRGPREQWYKVTGADASLTVTTPFAPGAEDRVLIVRRGWQRGKESEERIVAPGADQYQLLVEHFGDCVLRGVTPRLTLADTRANVAAVHALARSATEGGVERV